MQQDSEIRLEQRDTVILFDIQGDVTAFSEPSFNEAYKNATEQGNRKILMVFKESAYINSGGIAVLIQILAQTKRNNQQIGVTGLSEHFKKIFHMVGITKFAKVHNSIEEALEVMSSET
jgi:anti-anti-sigma factor